MARQLMPRASITSAGHGSQRPRGGGATPGRTIQSMTSNRPRDIPQRTHPSGSTRKTLSLSRSASLSVAPGTVAPSSWGFLRTASCGGFLSPRICWSPVHRAGARRPFSGHTCSASCDVRHELDRPDLRIYDLRHTLATMLFDAGAAANDVQAILGHSTIQVTERYSRARSDAAVRAAGALDRMMEGKK